MTKKKIRSQSNAEDKEQQYRIIFESASDGMIISDLKTGRVVDANPAAIAMHGYTREEFIGMHSTAYIHPDSQRMFTKSTLDPQLERKNIQCAGGSFAQRWLIVLCGCS